MIAQFLSELPLSKVWILLKKTHHPEIGVLLQFCLPASHYVSEYLLIFRNATAVLFNDQQARKVVWCGVLLKLERF